MKIVQWVDPYTNESLTETEKKLFSKNSEYPIIDGITPRFVIYPVGNINERSCDLCFANFSSSILNELSLPETRRELDWFCLFESFGCIIPK